MKAIDLINGTNLGSIQKLGPDRYLYNGVTFSFRGIISTLEEQGVNVCYL